ncbi:hypothetical protein Bca52824_080142 [Brassica carinata]|uniref:Uncharacterized protein n=1 Tax=Brassica carinata TaxID=52824 RepID=A0A8X7Q0W9_BRACI|nr:hypothetical protein Bca52824_080142 [Brassica carinata]
MWSSIENLKENLNKIALDVHDDDEDEEDLHSYGSSNGVGDVSDSNWRNSNGFRSARSVSRYPISNGIESPGHHEIERYKAEIKKLQESEADIKALSVNYAALLREKEDQISRLNHENGSLRQNLKEARTDISRESNYNAVKHSHFAYFHQRSGSGVTLSRRNSSLRLDKNKTSLEISKVRSELDAKLLEIKHLQMKLSGPESQAVGTAMEHLKEVNKALEKENNELKLKRSELEAALEESRRPTSSRVFPDATEALTRHPSNLDKKAFLKEELEQSLQRLETDLKETRRERDKARQELNRLKQHLLEKSEKMDEDSQLIEELPRTNEYQRSQISQLEKTLKQAMANQEDNRMSNDNQNRKLKETIEDLNLKLANCLRTIESKNVELLNLQTALGQYYANRLRLELENSESCLSLSEHFERELMVAKDEMMKLNARLKDADERLESSNKEKEDLTAKLVQAEKVAAEWKNRCRVLEQSMTRLNRMSVESDNLVDRRIVIKLLVTYFQKNHSKEVLDLMVRIGVLGLPGRFVGGILGGKSAGSHPNAAASDNQSFADLWVDFLLKDAEERERREAEEAAAAAAKAKQDSRRQDKTHLCRLIRNSRRCLSDHRRVIKGSRDYFSKIIK